MRWFIVFTCFILFTSCYENERNCNMFKTGHFEFTYTVGGVEKTTRFKRTTNYNIDFLEKGPDTSTIRWINNCEFVQKAKNPSNNSEAQPIHFKIISTTENSYNFEYSLAIKPTNRKHRVERGTAYKIE